MIIRSTKFRAKVKDIDGSVYEIVDNQFDYPEESFVSLEATFPEDFYHLSLSEVVIEIPTRSRRQPRGE